MRKLMLWNGSWKYNNILFYSCLHFLNRFKKFVNIFFIYVWIWYNCKQLSSTHNFCAHIFSTASEKTLRFVRIQILTVDSGISMQFNYLNCNIIYLYAYKKYYCVSFFFSKLSRIYHGNSLFGQFPENGQWQMAYIKYLIEVRGNTYKKVYVFWNWILRM